MKILKVAVAGAERMEELALSKQDLVEAREAYLPFLRTLMMFVVDFEPGEMPAEVGKYLRSNEPNNGLKFLARYKFPRASQEIYHTIVNGWLKAKGDFDAVEDAVEDFAVELRSRLPTIQADQAVPVPVIKLIADWSNHFRTGSDSAFDRMQANVGVLNDPWLSKLFTEEKVEKSGNARANISAIVKKLTGKPGIDLTKQQREQYMKSSPAKYKEFLAARRELIALGKKRLSQVIRGSGKPLMDAKKAKELLSKEGYIPTVPEGFVGQVDETGALFTSAGKKILGGSGGATSVEMNPKYNPTEDNAYVFKALSPKTGDWNNVYTEEFRMKRNDLKFKKTADFANKIEAIRAKWGAALMKDGHKSQPMALILEIAYQTQARIGNVGNQTEGKTTYGLTTLECRHANIMSQNKIRLLYPGKAFGKGGKDDGGTSRQKHYLIGEDKYSKKAVALLREYINTGSPSDPLVRWRDRRITSQSVNMYLKSLGSVVTVKTMRTMKGTLMARDLLSQSPFAKKPGAAPERKVTEWLKRALTKVGAQLGHMSGDKVTPNTAIRHYIDPSEIQSYYDAAGVRPPPAIEKILNHNRRL